MAESKIRRLRAVLRNAAIWGAAWAVIGGAVVGTVALFSSSPGIESLPERVGLALASGVIYAVRFGIAGAVIGTVFSLAVRFGYRGRRLADIDPLRFAALGAVVGGVGVPLYLQTMNVLSGGPIPWGLVLDDAPWAAAFGAVAAAGSILLARRAVALPGGSHVRAIDGGDAVDALPAADVRAVPVPPRERATQQR